MEEREWVWQYGGVHLVLEDFLHRVSGHLDAMEHLQIFAERKPLHGVHHSTAAQVGLTFEQVEYRRTGENHIQSGMSVIYIL